MIKLSIEHVLSVLNSFHQSIEFICELKQNGKIMLIKTNDTLQTTIYTEKVPIMVCIFAGTLLHQERGNVVHSG